MLEKLSNSVHNIHNKTSLHERLLAGQQGPSDTQITLCKFIRFTPLLHELTIIFGNCARQIYCTIQGINSLAAHIYISN